MYVRSSKERFTRLDEKEIRFSTSAEEELVTEGFSEVRMEATLWDTVLA